MSRISIQNEIVAQLQATPGVEANRVYVERPRIQNLDKMILSVVENNTNRIHAWFVRRLSTLVETAESTPMSEIPFRDSVHEHHMFQIDFYHGYVEGEAEASFQTIVDAVLTQFRDKRSLGGWSTIRPLQLMAISEEPVGIAYTLHARFGVTVIDQISGLAPT